MKGLIIITLLLIFSIEVFAKDNSIKESESDSFTSFKLRCFSSENGIEVSVYSKILDKRKTDILQINTNKKGLTLEINFNYSTVKKIASFISALMIIVILKAIFKKIDFTIKNHYKHKIKIQGI
jgi:hypothetical protein